MPILAPQISAVSASVPRDPDQFPSGGIVYCSNSQEYTEQLFYPTPRVINSPEDAVQFLKWDHLTNRPEGRRNGKNLRECNIVEVDIDNGHSDNPEDWITWEKARRIFPGVSMFWMASKSHGIVKPGKTPAGDRGPRDRGHWYFLLENSIPFRASCDLVEKIKDRIGYSPSGEPIADKVNPAFQIFGRKAGAILLGYQKGIPITEFLNWTAPAEPDPEEEKEVPPEGEAGESLPSEDDGAFLDELKTTDSDFSPEKPIGDDGKPLPGGAILINLDAGSIQLLESELENEPGYIWRDRLSGYPLEYWKTIGPGAKPGRHDILKYCTASLLNFIPAEDVKKYVLRINTLLRVPDTESEVERLIDDLIEKHTKNNPAGTRPVTSESRALSDKLIPLRNWTHEYPDKKGVMRKAGSPKLLPGVNQAMPKFVRIQCGSIDGLYDKSDISSGNINSTGKFINALHRNGFYLDCVKGYDVIAISQGDILARYQNGTPAKNRIVNGWEAVEDPGTFYTESPPAGERNGSIRALCEIFTVRDESFRYLIAAALLSPFWGPEFDGNKPAFATVAEMKSSGKSDLIFTLQKILDPEFPLQIAGDTKENDTAQFGTINGLGSRFILADNISSVGIQKLKELMRTLTLMVTDRKILAWRMGRSRDRVPNNKTVLVSNNTTEAFEDDFLERVLIIRMLNASENTRDRLEISRQIEDVKKPESRERILSELRWITREALRLEEGNFQKDYLIIPHRKFVRWSYITARALSLLFPEVREFNLDLKPEDQMMDYRRREVADLLGGLFEQETYTWITEDNHPEVMPQTIIIGAKALCTVSRERNGKDFISSDRNMTEVIDSNIGKIPGFTITKIIKPVMVDRPGARTSGNVSRTSVTGWIITREVMPPEGWNTEVFYVKREKLGGGYELYLFPKDA